MDMESMLSGRQSVHFGSDLHWLAFDLDELGASADARVSIREEHANRVVCSVTVDHLNNLTASVNINYILNS